MLSLHRCWCLSFFVRPSHDGYCSSEFQSPSDSGFTARCHSCLLLFLASIYRWLALSWFGAAHGSSPLRWGALPGAGRLPGLCLLWSNVRSWVASQARSRVLRRVCWGLLQGILEVLLQLFIVSSRHLCHTIQVGDYFSLAMDVFHISFSLSFHFVDIALQLIDQSLNLLLQDLLFLELLLKQSFALNKLFALYADF